MKAKIASNGLLLMHLALISNLLFAQPAYIKPDEVLLRHSSNQSSQPEIYVTFINTYADRIQSPTAKLHIKGLVNPIEASLFALTEKGWEKGHPALYGKKAAIILPASQFQVKHCTAIETLIELQTGVMSRIVDKKKDRLKNKKMKILRIKDTDFSSPCDYLDKKN